MHPAHTAEASYEAPATEPEAFGRIAVEAQAMGAAMIASDLGATSETILAPPDVPASERTGWLVAPEDAEDLAQAIAEALDLGAAGRDGLALRARKRVAELFSVERMCAATLSVYETLLEPNRAG